MLAFAGAAVAAVWQFMPHDTAASWPLTIAGSGAEHDFHVEVAVTEAEKKKGLMFREELADDAGMLFVYRQGAVRTMWMKDTRLPLDMVFIGTDGTIRKIVRNTTPYSEAVIISPRHIQYVLELRAGTARRLGIRAGDRVRNLPAPDYAPEPSS